MHEKVIKVLSQVMNVPPEEISAESSPDTIDAWDSLKHMNLVLALEEKFGVVFTDEEIIELLSVEIITATLKEKGAGKAGGGAKKSTGNNGRRLNV